MLRFSASLRAALGASLLIALLPAAHAQKGGLGGDTYYDMCLKAVDFPKPFGEWDLKGNAKLPAYCKCFSPLFTARAMKAAAYMQTHPGKAPPGTLAESNAEELAIRNTCRKQVGLPMAIDADAETMPAPTAKPAKK
jgi:hypothetical protein